MNNSIPTPSMRLAMSSTTPTSKDNDLRFIQDGDGGDHLGNDGDFGGAEIDNDDAYAAPERCSL